MGTVEEAPIPIGPPSNRAALHPPPVIQDRLVGMISPSSIGVMPIDRRNSPKRLTDRFPMSRGDKPQRRSCGRFRGRTKMLLRDSEFRHCKSGQFHVPKSISESDLFGGSVLGFMREMQDEASNEDRAGCPLRE